MKPCVFILTLTLILLASPSMADGILNNLKMKKIEPKVTSSAIQSTQGLPSQSVIEIKGRIDMGSTNYYSVMPEMETGLMAVFMLWLREIESTLTERELDSIFFNDPDLEKTFFGGAVRPQFKQSEQQGYSLYLFLNTAAHPKLLEAFKNLKQVEFPMGKLTVKYSQNGPEQSIYAHSPATGSTVTKTIGPYQPK
jgi:hypothetical protein